MTVRRLLQPSRQEKTVSATRVVAVELERGGQVGERGQVELAGLVKKGFPTKDPQLSHYTVPSTGIWQPCLFCCFYSATGRESDNQTD